MADQPTADEDLAAQELVAEDLVAEAVAALDELMSNALRHGRAPVQVQVCTAEAGLLLLVDDRAADDPPRPTFLRDPSEGGMGLGMVATTALSCGWHTHGAVKTVWALMPFPAPRLPAHTKTQTQTRTLLAPPGET